MGSSLIRALTALLFILSLAACGAATNSSSAPSVAPEAEYCVSGSKSPGSSPLTITGLSAKYYYLPTSHATGLSSSSLNRGIAYAEVVITDASGAVVQCSQTDGSGNITSFQIPKVAGTYTVKVNSRAFNSKIKVSVLRDVSSNAHYSASTTFTVVGNEGASKNVPSTITAMLSTSEQVGAAFHILYNIYSANEYLRSTIGNPTFVADKVTIYWKAGFNPGAYVGTSSPLSFYIQGSKELYILGGQNGNYTESDTDQFDDSVILHEYAHFLEDVYSKTDSPGGSHNGDFIIDPRLAWSEGWANFFQAAVISREDSVRGRYYIDTAGGDIYLKFNLSDDGQATQLDSVAHNGEGTFRELSVSRTLWKSIAPAAEPVFPSGAEIPFKAIWDTLTSPTTGLPNALNKFRNMGLFNSLLLTELSNNYAAYVGDWMAILANEKQNTTTVDYANPVTAQGACTLYPRDLSPVVDQALSFITGSVPYQRSNLLRSNDFYVYYHPGGSGTIRLEYETKIFPSSTDPIDLDLYIYKQNHVYQEDHLESYGKSTGGVAIKSDRLHGVFENGVETVSLGSLSPGYYLINVKANTFNKLTNELNGTAEYSLFLINGSTQFLCPAN